MENYNICDDLKSILEWEELDSKTLNYRLNMFMYACGIEIPEGKFVTIIDSTDFTSARKKMGKHAFIRASLSIIDVNMADKERHLVIKGATEDLEYLFFNRYNLNKIDKGIKELPFSIKLAKEVDGFKYDLEMESKDKEKVIFDISKTGDDMVDTVCFKANISDFSKILGLVKSFVDDPKLVFDTYYKIMKEKRISFTANDVKNAIVDSHIFDKPDGKIKKKIKILTNND